MWQLFKFFITMKKAIFFLCVAAAAVAMVSCKELADQLVNVPNFEVSEAVYSGQTQQIHKLSLCKFEFSAEDYTQWVAIEPENSDGKVFATYWIHVATSACKPVVITAKNAEDASVEPVSKTVKIHPWLLCFSKKNGDNWERMEGLDNVFGAGAGTYRIQMVALKDKGNILDSKDLYDVDSFIRSFNPREEGKLNWSYESGVNIVKEGNTYLEFTLNGNEGELHFGASLGSGSMGYAKNAIINTAG